MIISNNEKVMGKYKNGFWANLLGWFYYYCCFNIFYCEYLYNNIPLKRYKNKIAKEEVVKLLLLFYNLIIES